MPAETPGEKKAREAEEEKRRKLLEAAEEEAKKQRTAKREEKLKKGTLEDTNEWVSFGDAGENMQEVLKYLFYPLVLLVEDTPEVIEELLTAVDEVDAAFKQLEQYMTQYPNVYIEIAKTIIRTILKIFNKLIKLLLGTDLTGAEIKFTSVLAEKHEKTHIPMPEKLPKALDEAFLNWESHPEKKRVWGFVFFPYYLPLLSIINKTADMITEVENEYEEAEDFVVDKYNEVIADQKAAWDNMFEPDSDRDALKTSIEEKNAEKEVLLEKTIDMIFFHVEHINIADIIKKEINRLDEEILRVSVQTQIIAGSLKAELPQSLGDEGHALCLRKKAIYDYKNGEIDATFVLDTSAEYWITSINVVVLGSAKDLDNVIPVYSNPYYDILVAVPRVWRVLSKMISADESEGKPIKHVEEIHTMIAYMLSTGVVGCKEDFIDTFIKEFAVSLGAEDTMLDILSDTLIMIILYILGSKQGMVPKEFFEEDSIYNSIPMNYRNTQWLQKQKLLSINTIYGHTYSSAPNFKITLPKAAKDKLKELEEKYIEENKDWKEGAALTRKGAVIVINTIRDVPYAIPDEILNAHKLGTSKEDLMEIIQTYVDSYREDYEIKEMTEKPGRYVISMEPTKNVFVKAYEVGVAATNTHKWVGGSLASLTMKQILPPKAVKEIYKLRDEVNDVGEFIIKELELMQKLIADAVALTEMIRKLIDRFLRDYLVEILKQIRDAASLPAMGMVVGATDSSPINIPGLITSTLGKTGVSKDVFGGIVAVGGVSILSDILALMKLYNTAREDYDHIKRLIENATPKKKHTKSKKEPASSASVGLDDELVAGTTEGSYYEFAKTIKGTGVVEAKTYQGDMLGGTVYIEPSKEVEGDTSGRFASDALIAKLESLLILPTKRVITIPRLTRDNIFKQRTNKNTPNS